MNYRIICLGISLLAGFCILVFGCSKKPPTEPTTVIRDTIFVNNTDSVFISDTLLVTDTLFVTDTLLITDTVFITDTVHSPLAGDWLRFSAYLATINFVAQSFPARASDRFSSIGEYCNYGSSPAGRAGFRFEDQGDSTYLTGGYTFEHIFGPPGWIWGAAENQPTENVYYYVCTLRIDSEQGWHLVDIDLQSAGPYIRDTRHD